MVSDNCSSTSATTTLPFCWLLSTNKIFRHNYCDYYYVSGFVSHTILFVKGFNYIICFLRVGYFWFHSSLIIVDHLLYSSFVTRRILNLQPRVSPRPPSTTTPLSLPPPPRLLLLFCKPTTIYIPVVP